MADLTRTFKVARARPAADACAARSSAHARQRPHNRPFQCASKMRPATGAASAPPDRACNITVTTARIREACEPRQVHAGRGSHAARLSRDFQSRHLRPLCRAELHRVRHPGQHRRSGPREEAAVRHGERCRRHQHTILAQRLQRGRRVPYPAGAFAFAEPVGARREAPSLHLGRQFAGAKSRRIVSDETVARIRDRRTHGHGSGQRRMRAGERSPRETQISGTGKAIAGAQMAAHEQRVEHQRLQRRTRRRRRCAREFRRVGGDQAARLAVHQHTGAVRAFEEAVDDVSPTRFRRLRRQADSRWRGGAACSRHSSVFLAWPRR